MKEVIIIGPGSIKEIKGKRVDCLIIDDMIDLENEEFFKKGKNHLRNAKKLCKVNRKN